MAEGERVNAEWPEVTMVRFSEMVRKGNTEPAIHKVWPTAEPEHWDLPGYELRRYVPEDAAHCTQLVAGLEALEGELRKEAEPLVTPAKRLVTGFANEIRALIDQHKKEGRS